MPQRFKWLIAALALSVLCAAAFPVPVIYRLAACAFLWVLGAGTAGILYHYRNRPVQPDFSLLLAQAVTGWSFIYALYLIAAYAFPSI